MRRSAATSPAMAPIASMPPFEVDARLATLPKEDVEINAAQAVATAASDAQAAADDAKLAMLMADEVLR